MKYWIFKCNTKGYRLDKRLVDPNPKISWRVTRYREEISPRDVAFVWETGAHRGIRAMIKIDGDPEERCELPEEQQYNRRKDNEYCFRVTGKLIRRCIYISHVHLRGVSGLEDLSVFHGFHQGTTFRVTAAEAKILLRLVNA
jgi:hypothetical protein